MDPNTGQPKVIVILQALSTHWVPLLVTFLLVKFASNRYWSPLRAMPGPLLASFSRFWKVYHGMKGNFHHVQQDIHKKYGPIVRIAPNEVSFASPNAAKDIYIVSKDFDKVEGYSVFPTGGNTDIFTEPNEAKHAIKRRIASGAYSLKTILEMEDDVNNIERSFFERLDQLYADGTQCDLGAWVEYFAFDVIGRIVFSKDFGFVSSGLDKNKSIQYIEEIFTWYTPLTFIPEFKDRFFLDLFFILFRGKNYLLSEFAIEELHERTNTSRKSSRTFKVKDLLARWIDSIDENPEKFAMTDCLSIAFGALVAGSDSTASTIRSVLYELLKNPRTYSALQAEIDTKARDGKLSNPISYADAKDMPYLQAVMKEAMRLHPAVGIPMPRYVPKGGAEIDGKWYPAGTVVGVNAWVVHHDKEVFGQDADVFRPERWLTGDTKIMKRSMYQFGGGSHVCIGKNISMLEMSKLIPQLLLTYEIKLVHHNMVWKENCQFFCQAEGAEGSFQETPGALQIAPHP